MTPEPSTTRWMARVGAFALLLMLLLVASGCTTTPRLSFIPEVPADRDQEKAARVEVSEEHHPAEGHRHGRDVYRAIEGHRVERGLRKFPERVYVPNSGSDTVDVIDPKTYEIIRHFRVGDVPHHITPSWNMHRLYVDNTGGDSLTVIDPKSSRPTRKLHVRDPYNLYFTPDGSKAIVVAERFGALDFRDPHSWRLLKSVPIPASGPDHLDFSRDGRVLLISTEFSGRVYRVNTVKMKVTGHAEVGGLPVDVKLSPDGSVFFVANQGLNGVSVIDSHTLKKRRFIPTGAGAHGLCISRDARRLYVSNRIGGSISVIDVKRRRVVRTWHVGGSPDMMQVSPNGRQLWFSNRLDASVGVVSTRTGRLLHTISVGSNPHGLTFFPQPGRFSLGHNGVYR
jgi:YVTN family beta-propeller protein